MGLESSYGSITVVGRRQPTAAAALAIDAAAVASAARRVLIQADPDNTDHVRVGDSTVVSDGSAGTICTLAAGQSIELPLGNTGGLYVRSKTGTQNVYVSVFK